MNAVLLFHARATSERLEDAFAELELGGGLDDIKLVDGRLSGKVQLVHFTVRKASVGPLAEGLVEALVRENLGMLQDAIPAFEFPVRLDQTIGIDHFNEGPVSAAGGDLPLAVQVSEVLPLNQRLWILIGAKAGPWKAKAASGAGL
jgi:hypothetical protein